MSLVAKHAALLERRTTTVLAAQGHACIPTTSMLDRSSDTLAWMCQQDVGDDLDPDTPAVIRTAAESLAAIHTTNWGQADELAWLPRPTRAYFTEHIINTVWRPAWTTACANPAFVRAFAAYLAPVEAAAEDFAERMDELAANEETHTLVHMDLSVGNVLFQHPTIYFIDWQEPKYGPFYLDLPTHFWTLERAEPYRQALAARGRDIAPSAFAAGYTLAARYVAFRYVWWNLEAWLQDPTDDAAAWMIRYFKMASGEG